MVSFLKLDLTFEHCWLKNICMQVNMNLQNNLSKLRSENDELRLQVITFNINILN
jgi:hypothetical protein